MAGVWRLADVEAELMKAGRAAVRFTNADWHTMSARSSWNWPMGLDAMARWALRLDTTVVIARTPATADEIAAFDRAQRWIVEWLDDEATRQVVWAKACGFSYGRIGRLRRARGLPAGREALARVYLRGLSIIAGRLNASGRAILRGQ